MYCIEVVYIVYSILMADGGIHDNSTSLSINLPNLIFLNVLFTGNLLMFSFFFSGKVDKLFFLIVFVWKMFPIYLARKNKKTFSIKEEEEIFPCDSAVGEINNSKTNLTCYNRGSMKQHTTFIYHQTLTLYPLIIKHRVVWWILPLLFGVKEQHCIINVSCIYFLLQNFIVT